MIRPVHTKDLTNVNGKTLYAIACEKVVIHKRTKRRKIIVDIIHVHAESSSEAAWIFGQDGDYKRYNIIAVGPAIGFFVEDNHGEILHA